MRAHAHVEDNIKRLKDSGADHFPFTDIDANRAAWLAVACMADSLVRWFQRLCLHGILAAAEPKTLRWTLWHTPARIVRRARRHVVRILDAWPTADHIIDAYQRFALIT
jgi:Transposase DDE domain group 1